MRCTIFAVVCPTCEYICLYIQRDIWTRAAPQLRHQVRSRVHHIQLKKYHG